MNDAFDNEEDLIFLEDALQDPDRPEAASLSRELRQNTDEADGQFLDPIDTKAKEVTQLTEDGEELVSIPQSADEVIEDLRVSDLTSDPKKALRVLQSGNAFTVPETGEKGWMDKDTPDTEEGARQAALEEQRRESRSKAADLLWKVDKKFKADQAKVDNLRMMVAGFDTSTTIGRQHAQQANYMLQEVQGRMQLRRDTAISALGGKLYPTTDPYARKVYNGLLESGVTPGDAHYYTGQHRSIDHALSRVVKNGGSRKDAEAELIQRGILKKNEEGLYGGAGGLNATDVLEALSSKIGAPASSGTGSSTLTEIASISAAKTKSLKALQARLDDPNISATERSKIKTEVAKINTNNDTEAELAALPKAAPMAEAEFGSKRLHDRFVGDYMFLLGEKGLQPPTALSKDDPNAQRLAVRRGGKVQVVDFSDSKLESAYYLDNGNVTFNPKGAKTTGRVPPLLVAQDLIKRYGGKAEPKGGRGFWGQIREAGNDFLDITDTGLQRPEDKFDQRYLRLSNDAPYAAKVFAAKFNKELDWKLAKSKEEEEGNRPEDTW